MCMISNVGDAYRDQFRKDWPNTITTTTFPDLSGVTRKEFDELKKEVEELKIMLQAVKRFDEATGQPECQMDEKVEFIKKLADLLDVNMDGIF